MEGLQDSNACNVLLNKRAQSTLSALHGLTLPIDSLADTIDGNGRERKGQQGKQGQLNIDKEHDANDQENEHG